MFHEVGAALRSLIEQEVLNGADVDVSFAAPTAEWATERQRPTIDIFLHDIREDLEQRPAQFREVRDEEGRVTARAWPPRFFTLSYLVTAWAGRPEDEQRLLASVLAAIVRHDRLPADVLEGSLVAHQRQVRLTLAAPEATERVTDVWTALGGELRPSLHVSVTAPLDPDRQLEAGPPVTEAIEVEVSTDDRDGSEGTRERVGLAFEEGPAPRRYVPTAEGES